MDQAGNISTHFNHNTSTAQYFLVSVILSKLEHYLVNVRKERTTNLYFKNNNYHMSSSCASILQISYSITQSVKYM